MVNNLNLDYDGFHYNNTSVYPTDIYYPHV